MIARGFLSDQRGAVAVMAAVGGGVLCLAAAVAVDLGALALHGRRLQGAADLAALSAARDLDHADLAARATARDNVTSGAPLSVATEVGLYTPNKALAPNARFASAAESINAARVTVASPAPLFFSRLLLGRDQVVVTRRATAATPEAPKAMISLGSRLARLDGGVANQLLSGLTGSRVSLTAMDYRALADLDVNLLQFTDALATEVGVAVGDYDDLLATQVDAGRALKLIEALAGGRDGGALGKLTGAAAGAKVDLGRLIGVDAQAPDGVRAGLDASVSALDLAMAMLEIGGGGRQIALNLDAPAGLADVKTSLAIGERPNRSPWLSVTGNRDPIIRTAQARLYVRARTSQKLAGLAQVELPILVELAPSEARLKRLTCRPSPSVDVEVRPGLARAMIGAVDEARLADFKTTPKPRPVTVVSALGGLVKLDAKADVEAADTVFSTTHFNAADIAEQRVRTVAARGLAGGLTSSLLQRLEVTPVALGLGLGLGDLTTALGRLLSPLGPALDAVLNPLLDILGLSLGEADVTVHGLSCPKGGRAPPKLVG
jgi:uncharacterized membrane protein